MENKKKLIEQKIAIMNKMTELLNSKTARIREYLKLKEEYEQPAPKDSGLTATEQLLADVANVTGLVFKLPEKRKELDIFVDKIDSEVAKLRKKLEALEKKESKLK